MGSASILLSRDSETVVFRVASACALLHALDDAFLNRQPGVPLGQHALAAAIAVVVGGAAFIAFPLLRPGLRAGVALVFGVLATTNGAMHARRTKSGSASGGAMTTSCDLSFPLASKPAPAKPTPAASAAIKTCGSQRVTPSSHRSG